MAKALSPASPEHSHSVEFGNQPGGDRDNSNVREQDRLLPIANISRIIKRKLPAQAKIAKDAKETVQECVSEFISFITCEANTNCQREKRKTINGDDLLWAMSSTGLDDYVEPLKLYLHKYREIEGKMEGDGRPMSPGVQLDSYQMQMSQQMLEALGTNNLQI